MVFFLVGLGLGSEKDITVKGLEVVKAAKLVLLESYTAIFTDLDSTRLTEFYGREVVVADRDQVEQGIERYLEQARTDDIVLLVVGDVFAATTHTDLFTRCRQKGIPVEAIHNASIMNAVGCCGLQLYNFGRAISICFFTETWRPDSFYEKIKQNHATKLHSLLLLDIKVKEQSVENMARGKKVYEPPRFMTVNQCIDQLFEVEEKHGAGVCGPDTLAVGVVRVGHPTQQIVAGTLEELRTVNWGSPLHSLVLCGEVDLIEQEMLDIYNIAVVGTEPPTGTPQEAAVQTAAAAAAAATAAAPAKKSVLAVSRAGPHGTADTACGGPAPEVKVTPAVVEPPLKWKTPPAAYMTYEDDPSLGKPAPGLDSLEYVKGDPIALGSGKVSCLTFFAKFAKGDYTTVQGISPLADRFPDVQFVGIALDPAKADTEGFVKKIGTSMPEIYIDNLTITYPLAWDNGKAVKEAYRKAAGTLALGASAVFVVDAAGTIVWREQFGQGHAPHQGQLGEQIRRLVAGEELLTNGPGPKVDEDEDEDEDEEMGGEGDDYDYDSDLGF